MDLFGSILASVFEATLLTIIFQYVQLVFICGLVDFLSELGV